METYSDEPKNVSPRAIEAEEALLGSILINPEVLNELETPIAEKDFFAVKNGWVFAAIKHLYDNEEAIDNLTVVNVLKEQKRLEDIGGAAYITFLINNTPTHIHAETYARIVYRSAARRFMLDAASKIGQAALDEQAELPAIIEQAEQALESVSMRTAATSLLSGDQVVSTAYDQFASWLECPAAVRGLKSGIKELDLLTGGFNGGQRPYTFYGATGMGKSILAAFFTLNLAVQGPGLVITTELRPEFWIQRLAADISGIPYDRLKSGFLNDAEQQRVMSVYARFSNISHNLNFFRGSSPTVTAIRATCRRLHRLGLLQWVIVDSVSKISSEDSDGIYDVTTAASGLTSWIATDLGVPVIQTCQIGRNVKNREDKRPKLNDAKGSGSIEEDSSWVFGVYRHEYYVRAADAEPDPQYLFNTTVLMILKSDEGKTGNIPLLYEPGSMYTYDYDFEARGDSSLVSSKSTVAPLPETAKPTTYDQSDMPF